MDLDIDSGKLLYALGVLFAAGAFVYFVRDVVFGLSITVKAFLLFGAFVGFFFAGVAVQRDILDVVALALSALAYVVFVGYVLSRYEPGDTAAFVLFAGSAALFVGLGYHHRQGNLSVPRRTAGSAILIVVAVGLVLVGADLVGGGVTYTVEMNETVTVAGPETSPAERETVPGEARVGTVTATNGFVFARPLDLPALRGCLVGAGDVPDDRVSIRYEERRFERTDVVPGNADRTFDITARIPIATNGSRSQTFTVERADSCDVSRSEPTVVVVRGGDEGR